MAVNYSPAIVKDGLVLHLDAANYKSYPRSGNVWSDRSGFGNNGTLTNGPTFSSTNGGNIVFDGTNDYIDIPNSSIFNTTVFTISAWAFPTAFANYKSIMAKLSNSSNYEQFGFNIDVNGGVFFQLGNNSGARSSLNLNQWNHVCGVCNGVNGRLYVNSIINPNIFTIGTEGYSASNPVRIGNTSYTGNSRYFSGNISIVKIYNKALSASEVLQNFNATRRRFGL